MGITQVTAAVCNPGDPERHWEGSFLVDIGAIDCLVPGNRLREIGIEPQGKRSYEFADGKEVAMDIAGAPFEFIDGYI